MQCLNLSKFGFSTLLLIAANTILLQSAKAQTYTVLHSFTGGVDGSTPYAGLTFDQRGNLYGTTSSGGSAGAGTVFQMTPSGSQWIFTPLYSFLGGGSDDAAAPLAGVVFGPDGRLYGTTEVGGGADAGTVFSLRPPATVCKTALCPWEETVIYSFSGGLDGAEPQYGNLVFDRRGNMYGTTFIGGSGSCFPSSCGVVYKLTPSAGGYTESVVYNFQGEADGANPFSGVVSDQTGNLYGTAMGGIYSYGTVYELRPSGLGWSEATLYAFRGDPDGEDPVGGLVFDNSGNLYGATVGGGSDNGGMAYELMPSGDGFVYSMIYSFVGNVGPLASLSVDAAGDVFGTTSRDGAYGQGSVFKLTPSNGGWTYTSLHDFIGFRDGDQPSGPVTFDASGNLYGTTTAGGAHNKGVVWEITP